MAHKYLKDLGYKNKELPWNWFNGDQKRSEMWKKERKIYGFDERDTWSLRFTLYLLVYERLKWYRDHAPVEMDKPDLAHDYEFEGETITLGQALDRILSGMELYLKQSDDERHLSEEELEELKKVWQLLGIIQWSLWW